LALPRLGAARQRLARTLMFAACSTTQQAEGGHPGGIDIDGLTAVSMLLQLAAEA